MYCTSCLTTFKLRGTIRFMERILRTTDDPRDAKTWLDEMGALYAHRGGKMVAHLNAGDMSIINFMAWKHVHIKEGEQGPDVDRYRCHIGGLIEIRKSADESSWFEFHEIEVTTVIGPGIENILLPYAESYLNSSGEECKYITPEGIAEALLSHDENDVRLAVLEILANIAGMGAEDATLCAFVVYRGKAGLADYVKAENESSEIVDNESSTVI